MVSKKLELGSIAPDFYLNGVDNVFYSLDSFKDKKLLLIFFSCNHCPYVRAYEERIMNIQRRENPYREPVTA
jgi:peroxiredoxin